MPSRPKALSVRSRNVKRALEEAASADIVLVIRSVSDQSERSFDDEHRPQNLVFAALQEELDLAEDSDQLVDNERVIPVLNKIDLEPDSALIDSARDAGYQTVSAATGEGVEALRQAIRSKAGFTARSNLFTARKRHLLALKDALVRAEAARDLAADTMPGELIAEELKAVHRSLGEIVGEMSSDALLGEIFANFCIGK
jgi:tRNA modification GTPase